MIRARRARGPLTLRSRLFAGIAATVAVSVSVMLVMGAVLTRRSLESDAIRALERQVELLAKERETSAESAPQLGDFLATEQIRLAVVTPAQAELLLPPDGAADLRADGAGSGRVRIGEEDFLYAARTGGSRAFVLLRSASSQAGDWNPYLIGLAIAAAVGAALAAGSALLLSRAVARPLTRVVDAVHGLAAGGSPLPLVESGTAETAALAASFNHLSEELHRAQDAEKAFLLSVSHELKTPLTVIRGHAEALLDGVIEPERGGQVIERESHRLERLIGDLLDLARLRRRTFDVVSREVDLATVAAEAAERHGPRAANFGVSLLAETADGPCPALGDRDRLLQAVSNLVENAVRCVPRGGTVRIVPAPGRVDVVDDGPGLAPDELDRAFERFFLYERYGSDRPVGTGLGLAVVQELAHTMGGSASVASDPGRGSTFTIRLPLPPITRPRSD